MSDIEGYPHPAENPSHSPVPAVHWGKVDNDLLYDQVRYFAYARAHHVAAHHWAMWRLGATFGPAGLALRLPPSLDPETAADIEASAVLIEALAVEFARELHRFSDFGIEPSLVDWDEVRDHVGLCWREARARGCRWLMPAAQLLGDHAWVDQTAWYALQEWEEIASLADALGSGATLERDEVVAMLRWW